MLFKYHLSVKKEILLCFYKINIEFQEIKCAYQSPPLALVVVGGQQAKYRDDLTFVQTSAISFVAPGVFLRGGGGCTQARRPAPFVTSYMAGQEDKTTNNRTMLPARKSIAAAGYKDPVKKELLKGVGQYCKHRTATRGEVWWATCIR